MINPIALLEEGIRESDWQKVCDAYSYMTGTELDPPETPKVGAPETFPPRFFENLGRHVMAYVRDMPVDGRAGNWKVPDEVRSLMQDKALGLADDEHNSPPPAPKPAKSKKAKSAKPKEEPAKPVLPRRDDFEKFRVPPPQPKKDGDRRQARTVPMSKMGRNEWKDDRSVAAEEVEDSVRLSQTKVPEPRRAPPKKVEVTCCKCNKTETITAALAPRSVDRGDNSHHVCNSCIKRGN